MTPDQKKMIEDRAKDTFHYAAHQYGYIKGATDQSALSYPKQDVDEMMQYFQYSVHTIKALKDKLRAVGHTGFETTHMELQQKINEFTEKHK